MSDAERSPSNPEAMAPQCILVPAPKLLDIRYKKGFKMGECLDVIICEDIEIMIHANIVCDPLKSEFLHNIRRWSLEVRIPDVF